MARTANIGELKTRIRGVKLTAGIDEEGFQTLTETPLFKGKSAWCKWTFSHGNDIYEHMRLGVEQMATITMYFTEEITPQCKIWRNGETGEENAWHVVSINHVEDSRRFTEIRVKRGELA